MKIFEFAFWPNFNEKISYLGTSLCKEKWSFGNNNDNTILKNYIEHTYLKLKEEGKIIETDEYCVLNTGLYTEMYEPIYCYFIKNKFEGRQKWYFDNFYTSYSLGMLGVNDYPDRADYFQNPSELVFDTNCDIIPQYGHIFTDSENYLRIPEQIRDSPMKKLLFDGAINMAKHMINANYKTAVPQYYKGKIQLLIPICLTTQKKPDLALVVSKNENSNQYLGHTCLTFDMAYNNARLIARPDSAWLVP